MKGIFPDVCRDFEAAELVDFNGERDHVHLQVNYPLKVAVSKLVNSLKGVSSQLLRKIAQIPLRKGAVASKFSKGFEKGFVHGVRDEKRGWF